MRRLCLFFAVLALSLIGVSIAPQKSAAAPLVGSTYSAAAGGALTTISLDRASGPDLAGVTLAVSESKLNGGTPPTSSAFVSNLGAGVTGVGIAVQTDVQNAPPDNLSPDTDSFAAASGPDVDLGLLDTSVHARDVAVVACTPSGGVVANSRVQTAGAILDPVPFGTVANAGDSSTTGTVSIVPEGSDPLNRAVLSSAIGTISTSSFLNGDVNLTIAGDSQLQAFASGVPGGANTTYSPGSVSVTVGSTTYPVALGGTFDTEVDLPNPLPNGRVVITVNEPNVTESANGQNATASVAVVRAVVTVGTGPNPPARATVDILPLRASAVAPPGGLDCLPPPPVLSTPADNSTTADTTPTFTGTAVPGARVDIFVDGDPIGTTTANGSGNFSFTPGTPLRSGSHIATARQITDGGTSQASNANDFTVVGPPVLQNPADGTVTSDTTPTFTGRAAPGAQVDILVDGNPIGTTTANAAGAFTFTPGAPMGPGNYEASARATLNGVTSGLSNINDFTIDVADPAAPTLNRPADGEATNDTTPTFSGRAEPGAEVEIFVDGSSIGTTTANSDGDFAFTPTTPLAAGQHEAFVRATDAAGNDSSPSNTNGFVIDTDDPAAPIITSPEDGSTTTDPTFAIRGTAEPGSQVIIIRDGEEIGSTMADENGDFSFDLPSGLLPVGRYGFSARVVDEAGNSSRAAEPVYAEVLGTHAAVADAPGQSLADSGGPGQSLADSGGPQGWLPAIAVLSVLAGAGVLAATRWRRRSSHVQL
jgi:hypothetical protein